MYFDLVQRQSLMTHNAPAIVKIVSCLPHPLPMRMSSDVRVVVHPAAIRQISNAQLITTFLVNVVIFTDYFIDSCKVIRDQIRVKHSERSLDGILSIVPC